MKTGQSGTESVLALLFLVSAMCTVPFTSTVNCTPTKRIKKAQISVFFGSLTKRLSTVFRDIFTRFEGMVLTAWNREA